VGSDNARLSLSGLCKSRDIAGDKAFMNMIYASVIIVADCFVMLNGW
jgi:hypothetical protein